MKSGIHWRLAGAVAGVLAGCMLLLLVSFGKDIADHLKEQWNSLHGQRSAILRNGPPPAQPMPKPEPPAVARGMPELPWPPPPASAWDLIPNDMLLSDLTEAPTFAAIGRRLSKALDSAGYFQRGLFAVPNRLRDRDANGTDPVGWRSSSRATLGGADRQDHVLPGKLILRNLLYAETGHYRLVVLILTDAPLSMSGEYLTIKEARGLAGAGAISLDALLAGSAYTPNHRCAALIYEFIKSGPADVEFVQPSSLPGRIHLQKARILSALDPAQNRQ